MHKKRFHKIWWVLFCILVISCQDDVSTSKKAASIRDYQPIAAEAKSFIHAHNLNTKFFVLIDFSIHSGKKRFFIWNFEQNTITHQYLVSHGCCSHSWSSDKTKENPTFSNIENSYCSSLGKFIIGDRGMSSWGVKTKYLLHGMESSNSNALKRTIVFHSWERVSDEEVYPQGTPEGWGCPAISNNAFRQIDPLLKGNSKRTLMWAIN